MTPRRLLTLALTKAVRAYQLVVSPWFAPTCRYYPSCSQYAIDALTVHGPFRGTGMAAWRLLRCNPWSAGGVDHVPGKVLDLDPHPTAGDPDAPTSQPARAARSVPAEPSRSTSHGLL